MDWPLKEPNKYSAFVQYQDRAGFHGIGSAIRGGHIADEYEARPQDAQRGSQTERLPFGALIEKRCLSGGGNADDG